MVNVTSGLVGKNPHRHTAAVIQVDLAVVSYVQKYKMHVPSKTPYGLLVTNGS